MHGPHHFILAASFTSHVHVYCMHYYSKSQKRFLSTCYWTGAYLLAAVHLHAWNNTSHVARRHFTEQKNSSALGPKSIHAPKDGSGWLNIRIIHIHIRLKYKYGYLYSYSILIWMHPNLTLRTFLYPIPYSYSRNIRSHSYLSVSAKKKWLVRQC